MEQWEKCDICLYKDINDNCTAIIGCMGSRTPCNYVKSCEVFRLKQYKCMSDLGGKKNEGN